MDETRIILLVERARAGDRNAFGELVAHFEPTVFAIVMRRLRNRSEAAEVTQDVFIQAMRKIDQLREPERFAGWLRQIAVRMSINRAVRRPHEAVSDPEVFGGVTGHEAAPLERAIDSERAASVRDGIARLKELDRQTLIAFYFEGQSLQEMSDAFDSPVGTIKRRLHTARNRLKAELGECLPA